MVGSILMDGLKKVINTFTISNDGSEVSTTDYWFTDRAIAGYPYLSVFASKYRLLVPGHSALSVDEMLTGRGVIVTRGRWKTQNNRDALELLFEDGSKHPYTIYLVSEQVNRMPHPEDRDKLDDAPSKTLSIYTEEGKIKDLPVLFRVARSLPCLAPWSVDTLEID